MPGRKKSEWSAKRDELKAQLPKGFDARHFRGCRVDGKLDKNAVSKVAEKDGFKGKAEAIVAFLTHMESVPTTGTATRPNREKPANTTGINLLAKKTYADLSHSDIVKIIAMLNGMVDAKRKQEIEAKEREMARLQKELEALKSK